MPACLVALLFAVRPVDPIAVDALDVAMRAPIVRTLIASLEGSNLVVHIQTARDLPAGIGGITQFVTSRGGHRYVRITIAVTLTREWRAAILAHELQHAREIADSGADDLDGVERVFTNAGRRDGQRFETRAAIQVERTARGELRNRLEAEPVVKFHH